MLIESKKHLGKNALYNLIGLILPAFAAVFTIPQLVSHLGTSVFGLLTLLWMVISYASLFDLGLGRALTQQLSVALANARGDEPASLVWTTTVFLCGLGVVVGAILWCSSPWLIQRILHVPNTYYLESLRAFHMLAISLPFVVATDSMRGILEAHQEFKIVNIVRLPMGIYTFVAPLVVALINPRLDIIAIVLLIGKLVNFILYFYYALQVMPSLRGKISFCGQKIIPLLTMGGWMSVSNIMSPLMGYFDRIFITGISLAAVTYYVTPNELITKLWLITGALSAVFFPEMALNFVKNKERAQQLFVLCAKYIVLLIFPLVLTVIYFSHYLLSLWVNSAFADQSFRVLQWLALGVLINSLSQVSFTVLQAKGRSDLTAKAQLIQIPFYFLVLWFVVKWKNIDGIAMVWTGRMVVDALLMTSLAYALIRYKISTQVWIFAGMITAFLTISFFEYPLTIKIVLLVVSLAITYYFSWRNFTSAHERQTYLLGLHALKRIFRLNWG
jgi:O-antigen/teichoic acid export membrane protein